MTPSPNRRRLTSHRADSAGSRRHLPTERWDGTSSRPAQ
jgi:hypothetical protein